MNVKEVENVGKKIAKYVSYKGFNLWEIAEAGIYNAFLSNPKRKTTSNKLKDYTSRSLIKIKSLTKRKKKSIENKTPNYLFISYDVSHVKTFIPLLKQIKKFRVIRYDNPITEITRKTLEANNIPYNNLDSYTEPNMEELLNKADKDLSESWSELKKSGVLQTFGDNSPYIQDVLEYFFVTRKRFLELVRIIELFENVFKKEKILKLIVSDDVNAIGRIACLMAKRYDIPSLVIQHGQLHGNPVGKITADKMVVNGYAEKKLLESKGADKNKIIVAGQPRFDKIKKILKLDKRSVCKELDIDPDKKTIMFTAQKPTHGENVTRSALKCFIKETEKIKDNYNFLITIREDWSKKEIKNVPRHVKIVSGGNIQKILMSCDVLVTAYSTVAIEAVLLNKPVITININNKSYIDYTKEGVGIRVLKEEEFLPAIKTVIYDTNFFSRFKKARNEFIRKYNYKLDGKATERIIKIIKYGTNPLKYTRLKYFRTLVL